MALNKYKILLCSVTFMCYVTCDLNLAEDSPCVTGGLNGTCVNIFRCDSAALTYLYINAGLLTKNQLPELPDICSYKNNEPVVCCTDCEIDKETYRHSVVGAHGELVDKEEGPVATEKCYEYFQRLPYACRFPSHYEIEKIWQGERKCHTSKLIDLGILYAIGGRDARRWEFPHVALIGYGDDVESAQWLCGGSVISERFILTAAHCTSTRALGNISFAALGILKRTDPQKDWKIHKIKRIILHSEYKAPSKYHDIALLETETEIAFGQDLLPACLDVGSQRKVFAEASGWGRLGHRQDLADTLQVVILDEFNETDCAGIFKPHRHLNHGYSHEKQMCYGSHTEIIDTCEGDSGGPLQVSKECVYYVAGVTSYGKDCGILGSAGMYTRVSYYVPWIESIVWPEETEARRKKDNQWLDKWLN